MTVGEPGIQGPGVTGIQGWGVKTPKAAEVAAATWGLLSVVHMPNGMILVIETLSWMLPAGWFAIIIRFIGRMIILDGANPNEQVRSAPFTRFCAIGILLISPG